MPRDRAKFWLTVLSELKSRGVAGVCICCCDGLTGLPDAISVVWPAATVQLCVAHLIRASLRYASKKDWGPLTKDLRLIYTVADETAARAGLETFEQHWGQRYPAIVRLWRSHWTEFTPFLAFPPDVRRVGYTTNLIESMNARLRRSPATAASSLRAGGAEGALPRRAQHRRVPLAQRRDAKFGLEESVASVHDLLRGTHPYTMTAMITYTDGLTLPGWTSSWASCS